MAKITPEMRTQYNTEAKEYQDKIAESLKKEVATKATITANSTDTAYKKIDLAQLMIYVSSLYMAQNELSIKILGVKNNDVLNDARKILYKAIIYLEEVVTNIIDMPYSELIKNYNTYPNYSLKKRLELMKKLGFNINALEAAFGDNSKWKWSFVEIKGRYTVVLKNFVDMRVVQKAYFDPSNTEYEDAITYMRLVTKHIDAASKDYRDKYELSTRRLDDMKDAIRFLYSRYRVAIAINDSKTAEEVKKKAAIWKDKMLADQKKGLCK